MRGAGAMASRRQVRIPQQFPDTPLAAVGSVRPRDVPPGAAIVNRGVSTGSGIRLVMKRPREGRVAVSTQFGLLWWAKRRNAPERGGTRRRSGRRNRCRALVPCLSCDQVAKRWCHSRWGRKIGLRSAGQADFTRPRPTAAGSRQNGEFEALFHVGLRVPVH